MDIKDRASIVLYLTLCVRVVILRIIMARVARVFVSAYILCVCPDIMFTCDVLICNMYKLAKIQYTNTQMAINLKMRTSF